MTNDLPNFMVVGAAKAGTSSLYSWFKRHPDVYVPELKEPTYFVPNGVRRGINWYKSQYGARTIERSAGDFSASYLATPESPRLIRDDLGDVKIIIILRNPSHRALSLYKWMSMEGYEWCNSFKSALIQEDRRASSKIFQATCRAYYWDYLYLRSGLYSSQVTSYINNFSNVLICLFDDLIQNSSGEIKKICDFINVDYIDEIDLPKDNVSHSPDSIFRQFSLRCAKDFSENIIRSKRMATFFSDKMKINIKSNNWPDIGIDLKEKLSNYYRNDIMRLQLILDKDLSSWL